jgi:hypothetical protein
MCLEFSISANTALLSFMPRLCSNDLPFVGFDPFALFQVMLLAEKTTMAAERHFSRRPFQVKPRPVGVSFLSGRNNLFSSWLNTVLTFPLQTGPC